MGREYFIVPFAFLQQSADLQGSVCRVGLLTVGTHLSPTYISLYATLASLPSFLMSPELLMCSALTYIVSLTPPAALQGGCGQLPREAVLQRIT